MLLETGLEGLLDVVFGPKATRIEFELLGLILVLDEIVAALGALELVATFLGCQILDRFSGFVVAGIELGGLLVIVLSLVEVPLIFLQSPHRLETIDMIS